MNILITGTSKGIGEAIARDYLENGHKVFGISRTESEVLKAYPEFYFLSADIADFDAMKKQLPLFLNPVDHLDLVILNAGILNEIKDLKNTTIEEIKKVMDVNVWANKLIIDVCFENLETIGQIVAISSGAGVSGARGWNAYSLSKATLNMLIDLYAKEHTDTHFSAMTPGVIDTQMQDYISGLPGEKDFPVVKKLKKLKNTPDMPQPEEVSGELIGAFEKAKDHDSGAFLDKRQL